MATTTGTLSERLQESVGRRFNWQYFLQDNITGSWLLTLWVVVLGLATLAFTISMLGAFPLAATIILAVWVLGILLVAAEGLHIRHSRVARSAIKWLCCCRRARFSSCK